MADKKKSGPSCGIVLLFFFLVAVWIGIDLYQKHAFKNGGQTDGKVLRIDDPDDNGRVKIRYSFEANGKTYYGGTVIPERLSSGLRLYRDVPVVYAENWPRFNTAGRPGKLWRDETNWGCGPVGFSVPFLGLFLALYGAGKKKRR